MLSKFLAHDTSTLVSHVKKAYLDPDRPINLPTHAIVSLNLILCDIEKAAQIAFVQRFYN